MKVLVSVLMAFCFSLSWGQKSPAWENNIYWYNQYNTGRTFLNVWTDIYPLPNGAVFLKPYRGIAAKIGANYCTDISFQSGTQFSHIASSFILKNQLFAILKGKIHRIDDLDSYKNQEGSLVDTLPEGYHYDQILVQNNRAYIVGRHDPTKTSILYVFDGEKVQTLKKFDGILFKIGIYNGLQHWYFNDPKNNTATFYTLKNNELHTVKQLPFQVKELHFNSVDDFYFVGTEMPYREAIYHHKNGKNSIAFPLHHSYTFASFESFFTHKEKQLTRFYDLNKSEKPIAQTTAAEKIHHKTYSPETESIYFGTINDLARMFLLLKKYPRLFNESNSDAIFSIGQTADGKVWAGSYNGYITTIDGEKQTQSKVQKIIALPGGVSIGNKRIFNDEYSLSLLLFENENSYKKIAEGVAGFYSFISSKNVFYTGVNGDNGLMYKPLKDIENTKIPWQFAGKDKGVHLANSLTIAEDRFGNIWTGHTTSGIAVYQPDKNQGKTWRTDKNEINFGSQAIRTDSYKTLWVAASNGKLYYYNGKHKDDFDVKNFIAIRHPFFDLDEENISFIHQWKDQLILGKQSKLLLFNLKEWHKTRRVKVRYLNPMEFSLTGMLGQHTIFTDFRDETVWFSTNTMLYNWDIRRWLNLPTYPVKPSIHVSTDAQQLELHCNENITLPPDQNSFELQLLYQSKDNMPRYTTFALFRDDEHTPQSYSTLSTDKKFDFNNIASGDYTIKVLVCQQDGSYDEFQYHITVQKYWWEYWLFWAILSLLFLTFIYFYFHSKRKIEQQKREIAQLNLITLSKQFRPHFMLNALNSLGSQMLGMPHAERIISRIGESINIMYSFIKKNKIYLPFQMEWKLTLNTIDIQREIFIKNLVFEQKNIELIPSSYNLPIGLLQIVVENALLHGIRHRKQPPYLLKITAGEDKEHYIISVEDNGVGKENSAKFIHHKGNGTGIQKIYDTINIINSKIPNALSIQYQTVCPENKETPGTLVIIKMKKHINYEKYGL